RPSASRMRSMFSTRAWLGPQIQIASTSADATISSMEPKARASPTRSSRASAAASSARSGWGLHTPRTSASRTPRQDWMWKRVMKPLPMNPTPSRPAMPGSALGRRGLGFGHGGLGVEPDEEDGRRHEAHGRGHQEQLREVDDAAAREGVADCAPQEAPRALAHAEHEEVEQALGAGPRVLGEVLVHEDVHGG